MFYKNHYLEFLHDVNISPNQGTNKSLHYLRGIQPSFLDDNSLKMYNVRIEIIFPYW